MLDLAFHPFSSRSILFTHSYNIVLLESVSKGNNKITELRTILQRESQNSYLYKQTKSVNNTGIGQFTKVEVSIFSGRKLYV